MAWGILLAVLWKLSPSSMRWARLDWAIWTMTVGSVVMAIALLVSDLTYQSSEAVMRTSEELKLWVLLGGLAVADGAMGWVLTRNAPSVGISRFRAAAIWIGGMNGFLLAVAGGVWCLERSG